MSFTSEVVERLVCQQFISFLEKHKLLLNCLLAYRRYHLTETAVLNIVSNALSVPEKDEVTLLDMYLGTLSMDDVK